MRGFPPELELRERVAPPQWELRGLVEAQVVLLLVAAEEVECLPRQGGLLEEWPVSVSQVRQAGPLRALSGPEEPPGVERFFA